MTVHPFSTRRPALRLDAYDDWAGQYDQAVGAGYGQAQWQFLQRVLLPTLAPGAAVLDLCCGSGQLAAPLLARGFAVTGLDGSPAMLDQARRHAPQARWLQGDARDFRLDAPVAAVFSTSASLNHIDSIADLQRVFGCVRAALQPGGLFAFDLNHPAQLARWWRGRPTEGGLGPDSAWMITPRYDAASRRGAFCVTRLQGPPGGGGGLTRPLRRALYTLLARPRFIGLRLALVSRLHRWEPHWQRRDDDYPITGHDLGEVQAALQASGFVDLRLETLSGSGLVDERHAAHFIARKPDLADRRPDHSNACA